MLKSVEVERHNKPVLGQVAKTGSEDPTTANFETHLILFLFGQILVVDMPLLRLACCEYPGKR